MSRKVAVQQPQIQEVHHVLADVMAETFAIIRPFVVWPLLAIGAALLHHFWAASVYVIVFLVLSPILICTLVWFSSKHIEVAHFVHTVATSVLVAAVLGMVDVAGWDKPSIFAVLMVLPMICLTWSIRGGIYEREQAKGQHLGSFFDAAGLPDTHMKIPGKEKKSLFKQRKDAAELIDQLPDGKQRRPSADRRIKGTVHLPPGGVPDDVVEQLRRVESAAGYPPGTITVTPNMDHAGVGDVVVADPRVISKPIPYPGPSFIGGSIADTISAGVYKDGTENEFKMIEMQLQVMGITGSGKSLGACWSALSEIITRNDVVVWAIDVTKGMQTLGPLEPALHRLATDDDAARQLLIDVQSMIKPRTNYLAERGLSKWQKGCGLNYLIVWLEEVPDIMRAVGKTGQDAFIRAIKAARSAGITFVWSLQRADFRELPTIVRGQAAKWCFGVGDEKEATFGLSTAQKTAGCEPQLWGNRQPGMCFLDAPSVADDKIPMAWRTWYWGNDDSIIKAHALEYPASDKPYDEIMAATVRLSEAETAEKKPINIPMLDEETGIVMTTDQARTKVRDWLMSHRDQDITAAHITEIIRGTGRGRAWGYKAMREFVASGLLTKQVRDDETYLWRVAKQVDE